MTTPGDAASAASAAQSGSSHDLLGLGDTSSSREGHSSGESEAQSHNRNISGSSSVYFDAVDSGELSFGVSDVLEAPGQLDAGLEEGGVKLKGKKTNRGGLELSEGSSGAEGSSSSQSPSGVHLEGGNHDAQLTTAEYHPLHYQMSDVQDSSVPAGNSSGESTSIRLPATRVPSFGASVDIEEDRRNWERIQAITGSSTDTYNSVPGETIAAPYGTARTAGERRLAQAERSAQKRKAISSESTRGLDGARPSVSDGHTGNYRPPSYDESFVPPRSISRATRTRQPGQQSSQEMVVPRWQPDAEVTFCPICATQFSFFVRKHHCRKCGRVVCNACSPHRITIPYQFIVQPPTESDTLNNAGSRTRPALGPARAGSSSEFESLGGGERVRLCNPCVPDPNIFPNIAPPQTSQFANQPQRIPSNAHSRSASSTNSYTTPQPPTLSSSNPSQGTFLPSLNNPNLWTQRRPRQPSILRPSNPPSSTNPQVHTRSNVGNNGSSNQAYADYRARSATVSGSGVRQDQNPSRSAVPGALSTRISGVLSSSGSTPSRATLPHTPRSEHQTRPLPRVPRPPRIAEEDECPVCHQELPSSRLPNSEALRASHITNCIENAMQGPTSPPSPPPAPLLNAPSSSAAPSSSSSAPAPIPVPIANTPEARMAAREQAHAAVVFGQRSSSSPAFRPTGVFPYKATEKDCVDDAECTICLEEFEVGQDMGRLECFCRFHLHCIREWFVNHYGQCPVHQQSAY